ncbi:MAG: hypothetical protein WC554_13645 [Clostridia bacterium]|jgi:hypothetical protein
MAKTTAQKITEALLADLDDRSGMDIGMIDEQTMKEWRKEWTLIIQKILDKEK